MEKRLSSLIYFAFAALFFITPLLMFHKTSELFEFNKMLFIYLCAVCIGSLWTAKMIVTKKFYVAKTALDIPFAVFFLVLTASSVFSIDQHTSIFGYYGRFNGGLLSIGTYIFLFYAFVSNIEREKLIPIVKVSLTACLLTVLWSLPGFFGYDLTCLLFTGKLSTSCWTAQFDPTVRIFSTLGQPNWFGAYLAVHFFLGLYFFLMSVQKNRLFLFWTFYEILVFTAILMTRSRSALGSAVIGLIIFGSLLFERKKPLQNTRLKYLGSLLLLLLILLFVLKTGISRIDRILSGSFVKINQSQPAVSSPSVPGVTESFDIRKIVWRGGIELGRKYPLFGSGAETFAYGYAQTRPLEHNLTSEWDFIYNKAHNEYINYFATTGFFGLGTYIFVIGFFAAGLFLKIKKNGKEDQKIFLSSVFCSYSAILVTNFFGFSTTTINLIFYLLPAIVIVFLQNFTMKEYSLRFLKTESNKKSALFVPVILFFAGMFYLASYFFADISYALAENFGRVQEYSTSIDYYEKAIALREEHVYHDKLAQVLGNSAFFSGFTSDGQNATAEGYIEEAKKHSKIALQMSPQNPLYWRTKAKNSFLFFQLTKKEVYFQDAAEALQKAQLLAPTDPRVPYLHALFYISKDKMSEDDFKTAEGALNRAIFLKTNYRDAYFQKGILFKKHKKPAEAKKVFEYILTKINKEDEEAKQELESL